MTHVPHKRKKLRYNECLLWWCKKPYYAHGYCKAHYAAVRRFGTPYGAREAEQRRIEEAVTLARLISIGVTEFAQNPTEFAQQFHAEKLPENKHCVFCGNDVAAKGHKVYCVVRLSHLLLHKTAIIEGKEGQINEQQQISDHA